MSDYKQIYYDKTADEPDRTHFVADADAGCPYRQDDFGETEKKGVQTGTTIMAVEFDGGVIMGADSRTSSGDLIVNRVSRKVTRVHDRVYVCRSGSAADTQFLTSLVTHYFGMYAMDTEEPEYAKVNTAASLFQLLCYRNKDSLTAGLIVAGYDKDKGGQVYSVPLGGSKFRLPYAVGGSGSGYIMGLIDSEFKPGMKEEEARQMVKRWIAHAMRRDGSSGGVIRTITIKEDGVYEDFTAGDELPIAPL